MYSERLVIRETPSIHSRIYKSMQLEAYSQTPNEPPSTRLSLSHRVIERSSSRLVLTKILSSHARIIINLLPAAAIDVVRLRPALTVECHPWALLLGQRRPRQLHLLDDLL